MPTSVYAMEVAADEPEGWYRLNETNGSRMTDSGSGLRHGTFNHSVDTWTTGHPNQWETCSALEFFEERFGAYSTPITTISGTTLVIEMLLIPRGDANKRSDVVQIGNGLGGTPKRSYMFGFFRRSAGDVRLEAVDYVDFISTDYGGLTLEEPVHLVFEVDDGALFLNGTDVTDASIPNAWGVVSGISIGGETIVSGTWTTAVVADVAWYSTLAGARITAHAEAFTAPWDGDLTGARVVRLLDLAGWPSDLRDIADGLSILGPATLGDFALPLLKRAQGAEQGRLFVSRDGKLTFLDRYYLATETEGTTPQATLSDDGSDNGYSALAYDFDLSLVKNRIRASRRGGTEVEVTDATSITDYGDRSDTGLNGLDFSNDHQARSAAEFRLEIYKDPTFRVRPITVKLHGLTAAQQADLLDLELGYRVNVERTPQGVGSAIDQDYSIEGISHAVSNGAWEMTLRLAPVPNHMEAVGLWGTGEWDTAEWGY